jgi:hypothetical protein
MPRNRGFLRGDVIKALNAMVRDGAIAGFQTYFYSRQPDDDIVITIRPADADAAETAEKKVKQALTTLPIDVVIRVEKP